MKLLPNLTPPFLRRADRWLVKRYPLLWAARAPYAVAVLAALWGGLGAWLILGRLTREVALNIPDYLLEIGRFFYVGLWVVAAVIIGFWMRNVALRFDLQIVRRGSIAKSYLELLAYWFILSGIIVWPLAFQTAMLEKNDAAVADEELANDFALLQNGRRMLAYDAKLVPAEIALYMGFWYTNTLFWNMLHAPIDTSTNTIEWQNPKVSPYYFEFYRLYDDRPIEIDATLVENLPHNRAPFVLREGLQRLLKAQDWKDEHMKVVDFLARISNMGMGCTKEEAVRRDPELAAQIRLFEETGNPQLLNSLMFRCYNSGLMTRAFALRYNRAFPQFRDLLYRLDTTCYRKRIPNQSYERGFIARDFLEARRIAGEEVFGRYIMLYNSNCDEDSQVVSVRASVKEMGQPYNLSVSSISYFYGSIPLKEDWLRKSVEVKHPSFAVETPELYSVDVDHTLKYSLTKAELLETAAACLKILKKYGAKTGGLTPESIWQTQRAWDDTLRFPKAEFDLAFAKIERIANQKTRAISLANPGQLSRRVATVFFIAFLFAALLHTSRWVKLRQLALAAVLFFALVAAVFALRFVIGFDKESTGRTASIMYCLVAVALFYAAVFKIGKQGPAQIRRRIASIIALKTMLLFSGPAAWHILLLLLDLKRSTAVTRDVLETGPELFFLIGVVAFLFFLPFFHQRLQNLRARPEA